MAIDRTDQRKEIVDNLVKLLRVEADRLSLKQALEDHEAADIAEALEDSPEETRRMILSMLDVEQRVDVLDESDEKDIDQYVEDAQVSDLVEIIDAMPVDEAVDILERVDEGKAAEVIKRLEPEHAEDVQELRGYAPDTAGGIMTTEFFTTLPDMTAKEIITKLKEEYEEAETIQEIFVCREDTKLKGIIYVEDLISAEPDQKAEDIMDRATVTIGPYADQEICARYFKKYDLSVLAVIDPGRRMLGIITHDDIMEVMDEEAAEDMYRMAGVGDSNPLEHGALVRAYKRLPWLAATMIGSGLMIPLIINQWFHATLGSIISLAFFIPVIMGLGGNTAIQSSTIIVRGFATGEIEWEDRWHIFGRELRVGLIVATICAIIIGAFAYSILAFSPDQLPTGVSSVHIACTVAAAMFCGIINSVFIGTLVPMVCQRIGVDPAVAAGPFITTLIDIASQSLYLGLATWLLL